MDPLSPEVLDARFLFVVGKGGVGKTTTAAALAVALADRGLGTHLISTDPAHSLADVLGVEAAGGRPVEGVCSPRLVVEEFDAAAYARGPFRDLAEGLAELVERGTYLEAGEVRTFVDLPLPGVDEVMAALRLAELDAGPAARIVVDTAPTGHTLRLLDAGAVVRSWADAFRAMAEKASAVASRLARRPVRLAGEAALEALEVRVGLFERGVLGRASFLPVETDEPAVRAETARLIAELERRRLRVAAVVGRGVGRRAGALDPPRLEAPEVEAPEGCDGLRALAARLLAQPARAPGPAASPVASAAGAPGDAPAGAASRVVDAAGDGAARGGAATVGAVGGPPAGWPLPDRELLFFAGKGGVGKSTCAAACALVLSGERPVTLYGIDPAGSLGDVLGVEPPVDRWEPAPGLSVRQVDPAADLDRIRAAYRADLSALFARPGLEAAALDRRVAASFSNLAPPGLDELLALEAILEAVEGRRTLVVDTAPTGHFLRLLELPRVALDWVHALMRLLLRHRATGGLDDAAERLLRLARRLGALRRRLTDPVRTGVVVVTLDEPLVRRETERLCRALERLGVPLAAVLRNRVPVRAAAGAGGREAVVRRVPDTQSSGAAAQGRAVPGAAPVAIEAPLLARPPSGPAALRDFAAHWRVP